MSIAEKYIHNFEVVKGKRRKEPGKAYVFALPPLSPLWARRSFGVDGACRIRLVPYCLPRLRACLIL